MTRPSLTYAFKAPNALITLALPFQKTSGETVEQRHIESLIKERITHKCSIEITISSYGLSLAPRGE